MQKTQWNYIYHWRWLIPQPATLTFWKKKWPEPIENEASTVCKKLYQSNATPTRNFNISVLLYTKLIPNSSYCPETIFLFLVMVTLTPGGPNAIPTWVSTKQKQTNAPTSWLLYTPLNFVCGGITSSIW
jgi:hypothetical protein